MPSFCGMGDYIPWHGGLPVVLEKDPAGHGQQTASDDRVAPAPRVWLTKHMHFVRI